MRLTSDQLRVWAANLVAGDDTVLSQMRYELFDRYHELAIASIVEDTATEGELVTAKCRDCGRTTKLTLAKIIVNCTRTNRVYLCSHCARIEMIQRSDVRAKLARTR